MESEKQICVYSSTCAVALDVATGKSKVLFKTEPEKTDFEIKSVLMNPTHQTYAVDFGGSLFLMAFEGDILKRYTPKQPVTFWKWVSPTTLGIVTDARVYHWSIHVSIHKLQIEYAFDAMA